MAKRATREFKPLDTFTITVGQKTYTFTQEELRRAEDVFGLLRHRLRQDILTVLSESKKNEVAVSELLRILRERFPERYGFTRRNSRPLEQSVLSLHLNALLRGGYVARRRQGRYQFYQLVPERFDLVQEFLEKLQKAQPVETGTRRRRGRRRKSA